MGEVERPFQRDETGQEVVLKGREESGVSPSVLRGSQKALPEGREGPGGVGRPSWLAKRGRGGWEGSGVPTGGLGGSRGPSEEPGGLGRKAEDGRHSWRPGGVRRPSQRTGRGLEALSAGWEGLGRFGRPI